MPIFTWSAAPRYNTCLSCGTSSCDGGFIDTFAEVKVAGGGADGFVDAIFCANCVIQAAQLVGASSRAQMEEQIYKQVALEEENEKLKDEVQMHAERFNVLTTATAAELREFAESKRVDPPEPL